MRQLESPPPASLSSSGIGGAGGAILGAVFGDGLKGTILGRAAGAGIGAALGDANQNNHEKLLAGTIQLQ